MKIFYLIIAAFFLLLTGAVLPNQAYAVVCQNKTAIVYSNGMFNNEDDARISKNKLEIKFRSYPQASNLLVDLDFYLAYANDNGGFKTSFRTGLEQVFEVAWQALGDKGIRLFWEAVGGRSTQLVDPAVKQAMLDVALLYDKSVYISDKDFNSMMNGGNGFEGYRTLFSSGKRVLIVAHSQGNFYSNRVYREIADPVYGGNAALAASIGVVAVATPADVSPGGKLGLNEPNITVTEDFVIGHVRTSLGSLPSKSNRATAFLNPFGWSSNVPEIGWLPVTTQLEKTTYGHNFVTWYLAGTYTRDFIMKGITDTLNGVGAYTGLQYPKKCALSPPIPQPGPFYYRDDWADFTHYKTIPNLSPGWVVRDPHGQFKHLRDDIRGLAYKIELTRAYNRVSGRYDGAYRLSIIITDYVTNQSAYIFHPIVGNFVPDDVLLWSGGLLFIKYTNFHPSNDVSSQIEWRKFTINDNGIALPGRWIINNITSGVFNFPTYNYTGLAYFPAASGGGYHYVGTPDNVWRKIGVAYREGSSYTYRIPYLGRLAEWTNAPRGRYGYRLNGQYQAVPIISRKTYLGDFGSLEIIDGSFAFVKEGRVPLEEINGVQPALKPVVNGFTKIKQSMAYKYTQSFLVDAAMVNEAEAFGWGDGS